MQTRYYPSDDGYRVWLNPTESETLVDQYRGENLEREFALLLGLHGLRSDEITDVRPSDFRPLNKESPGHKLEVRHGKRHRRRELPVSEHVVQLANYSDANDAETVVDKTTKTLRDWITTARETLAEETGNDNWQHVTMHDLRRSWATTTFYTLAYAGNPIAEELVMGWGGWKMTASGRQTFRENYLGAEPDIITAKAVDALQLPK